MVASALVLARRSFAKRFRYRSSVEVCSFPNRGVQGGFDLFEGAGENHPPGQMSAKNPAEGVTRVVIVELLPKE